MNQEIFDHIYSNLSDNDKNIVQLRLSGKKYQEIAQSMSFDQSSVGRKLKSIAKKFKYSSESNLEWNEYLVQIFTQYKPTFVIDDLQEDYGFYPVIMPGRPEKIDSPFYIERHRIKRCTIESECYEAIEQPGSLVRIKAPSRMGKTSLIKRIQDKANTNNYFPIYLRFDTLIEPDNINNINNFLKAFNKNIKSQLPDVSSGLSWDDNNAKISCTQAFKELLINLNKNVVLLLDEVNEIFNYPEISKNFFAMLRSWYEESNNSEIWENLRMVIAYSTEYHGKLDIYQSPFNVGLPIELKEFTPDQITQLAYLHQLDAEIVNPLMSMVGGHPYLVRLGLYKMVQDELKIKDLLKDAPTESGIYQDHLSMLLEIMENNPKIKPVFCEILKANSPVRLPNKNREVRQLEAMGLIKMKGDLAEPRCQLYKQYFQGRLC
ncbi:MAG: AAA-like domain-containing protein [Cyanobacteria bacterium P01_H01_bin.35]